MKTKLGKLTKIKTGKLDANASSQDGEYPFFTCSREPLKISSYSYDCECVLVAGNGDLNVKYYNGKFDAYQRTYIIEDNSDGKLYMPYLYYFMEGYVEELRKQAIGGVIKYIKLGNLTDALIELPNIETQKKVVEILVKAKHIIDNKTSQIKMLDELIKSRFVEMFGDPVLNPRNWEMVELSQIAEIKIGPFGTLLHKEDYISGGHALVNPSHIIEGKICCDNNLSISEEKYCELESYSLKKFDLVLGRRGEMGRCAVVNEEGLLCGTGSLIIRSNGEISSEILQKIISFPSFKKTIEDKAVGQTMPNLNVPIVSKLLIPQIPSEVQNEYFTFVQQVDKLKVEVQKSLNETQLLFDSLMQKYYE